MDGASKYVRGDAMAGILILFINIIGGLVIGVVQHDLAASQAADSYTLLAIGDGLVAQIPALLISIAAGDGRLARRQGARRRQPDHQAGVRVAALARDHRRHPGGSARSRACRTSSSGSSARRIGYGA